MGVEPFLIASSVIGVIGQRLVRTVCHNCKVTYRPGPQVLAQLGLAADRGVSETQFARGSGCSVCSHRGYRGRTGVFEVLRVTDAIKRLVMEGKSALEIRDAAVRDGTILMHECGIRKVLDGVTSPEEVMRVLHVEEDQ